MKRILGLDVGDRTIGLALSDPLFLTAQGLKTIKRESLDKDLEILEKIIKDYNVDKLVIGLPKNMNNTIGPQGEKVIKFAELVEKRFKKDVILQDERLSTVAAERTLLEGDLSRKKRKQVIDMMAATYILQTFLDRR